MATFVDHKNKVELTRDQEREFGSEFLGDILTFIHHNYNPDEIFDFHQLETWAYDNGFTKEE